MNRNPSVYEQMTMDLFDSPELTEWKSQLRGICEVVFPDWTVLYFDNGEVERKKFWGVIKIKSNLKIEVRLRTGLELPMELKSQHDRFQIELIKQRLEKKNEENLQQQSKPKF